MITLVSGRQKWTVSFDRATAILNIQKAMKVDNWSLPQDYTFKNGVISRTSKEARKGKTQEEGDRTGDMASEPAEVSHRDGTAEE